MLSDIELYQSQKQEFDVWRAEQDTKHGVPVLPFKQFSAAVLTAAHWPHSVVVKPQLPYDLKQCTSAYEEYSKLKFPHKALSWSFVAGTMILVYNKGKVNEIVCTTLQGLVLLLFNSTDALTLQDICTKLGMTEEHGRRILMSLTGSGQQSILEKSAEGERFRLYPEFASQYRRLTLPQPAHHEEAQTSLR